jgi:hypothetical protein
MSRFRGIDQSAEEARRKQPRRERQRGELEGVSEETQERLAFLSDL